MNRTDIATTFIRASHAPIESHDLVADRIDVVGRMEILQLMRQQLPDAEEDERANTQQVIVLRMMHHRGDLAILVTVHVDATIDRQGSELVVLLVLLHMLRTICALEETEEVDGELDLITYIEHRTRRIDIIY